MFTNTDIVNHLKKHYLKEFYDGNGYMHPYSLIVQIVWQVSNDYHMCYHTIKKYHFYTSQSIQPPYYQIYQQIRLNTPTIAATITQTLPRRI